MTASVAIAAREGRAAAGRTGSAGRSVDLVSYRVISTG